MFFVLLAPLQELDTTRTDNPAGMTVVGLAMLLFSGCGGGCAAQGHLTAPG
jgi:hypothetical protein